MALAMAAPYDPDLLRAFLETRSCVSTLREVMDRPGVADRVLEVAAGLGPPAPMGPDRQQVLRLLA